MRVLLILFVLFSTNCISQNLVANYSKSAIKQDSKPTSSTLVFTEGVSYFTQEPSKIDFPNLDVLDQEVKQVILDQIKSKNQERYYYKNFHEDELITTI